MCIKKMLTAGLLVALLTTSYSTTFAESPAYGAFDDVDSFTPNFKAVEYLFDEGAVQGYADGEYKPTNKITRAEFLKIVMEAKDILPEGDGCFKDVNDWSEGYVCAAAKNGIIEGYADKTFKPTRTINFAEASKIIANTLDLTVATDGDDKNWYEKFVKALEDKNAIPDTVAAFDYQVTRGEMAEMVWRIKTNPSGVSHVSYRDITKRVKVAETGGALQTFGSCVELEKHLEEVSSEKNYGREYYLMEEKSLGVDEDDSAMPEATTNSTGAAKEESESSDNSSDDYSTTNVQVKGVDEADIVKTDGEYIYMVKDDATVRIVKAAPANNMKEMDMLTFQEQNFYPTDMYVDGNRLVVLGNSYGSILDQYGDVDPEFSKMSFAPYSNTSQMYIFDVSDKSDIKLFRKLSFEGDYTSSRKVDDVVYMVINKPDYNYYYDTPTATEDGPVPFYFDSATGDIKEIVGCGDVRYFPAVDTTNYLVVAGVDITESKGDISKEVILGSSGNIYASKENLYIADPAQSWDFWTVRGGITNDEKTYIHKFSLDETDIKYEGKGEVPGHILNQFSMDENDGYFRIATTKGELWSTSEPSTNNLYILDKDLKMAGSIEGIAPGESIYSVRFMGDRAYMVTFKKIDPLFVIDVENPKAPKILGKLKIPGYSDYLHPLDENHIIGFGKDAVDPSEEESENSSWDFAWYQGMKVAMFDVTDVENPKELHKEIIGDRGTDSPLLYNHKALMFDAEKGIMAFPVMLAEIPEDQKNDEDSASAYGDPVFQGAYFYKVSVTGGFDLMGTVTHYDDDDFDKAGYYWYGSSDIERILYIGDYLYTVSKAVVQANTYDADLKEVDRVELK
ncbi:MAG: beta-propeller domain-containing protein [Patescibacteria group bacterium]